MLADNPVWIALYVKPRHEKMVSTMLAGKGYAAFVPLFMRRSESGKKAELPLFPNYVFCRTASTSLLPLLIVPGVFSIVGNKGAPAPIPDDEIDRIKRFSEAGFSSRPWPYIAAGQQIRIGSGPLKGITGTVSDTSDHKWLVVSVHLLQQSVAVKLPHDTSFTVQAC